MDIRTKTEAALQTAVSLLEQWAETAVYPEENRLDLLVERDELVTAVSLLVDEQWVHLATITGLDHTAPPDGEPLLEALYHFCEGAAVLTLRVAVPHDDAVVPTICPLIPAATVYERELSEMLGITVTDTPNPDLLYLPDDWQRDTYPLRKDYEAVKRKT